MDVVPKFFGGNLRCILAASGLSSLGDTTFVNARSNIGYKINFLTLSQYPTENPPTYAEAIGTAPPSQSTGMFQRTFSVPAMPDNTTGQQTVYQPIQTAQPPTMMQPYPGPMPTGSSGYSYPQPPNAPTEPPKMPTYGSIDTHTTIVTTELQIIVVGGCLVCRIGVLEDDFTCCGIGCAICFFPIGILCCLAMRRKRCTNCGAEF